MNPDNPLLTPNIVPVEHELILPPGERQNIEAERAAMLSAIEAEEAERADEPDEEIPFSERCRKTVCRKCGHVKLVFLPAKLCEKCLRKAAEDAGLPFPEAGQVTMNRAQRRAARRKR